MRRQEDIFMALNDKRLPLKQEKYQFKVLKNIQEVDLDLKTALNRRFYQQRLSKNSHKVQKKPS